MFKKFNSDRQFAPAVRKPGTWEKNLHPFIDYMQTIINSSTTDIKSTIQSLGHFVTKHLTELHIGGPILEDQEDLEAIQVIQKNSKKVTNVPPKLPKAASLKITPSYILEPGLCSPKFEILGVIIREALDQARVLCSEDGILNAVLKGKHPTQNSSTSYNPDHTNPSREFSAGAHLFWQHLPPEKLATKLGLSILLSWMSTGQGNTTKLFLNRSSFFAESLAEMVLKFENVSNQNLQLTVSQGYNPQKGKLASTVRGYIVYEDMDI